MKHLNGKWLLAAAVLLLLVLSLWGGEKMNEPAEDVFFQEPTLETILPSVQEYHRDDLVFSVTIDDFIRCFNSLYEQDHRTGFFPQSGQWDISSRNRGIHTDYPVMAFRFSEDPSVFSLPTVTVYTPQEEHFIQEITISFDEHSYTEAGYQRYRLLCCLTIRMFFPEMSEEDAAALCDRIILLGNQNIFASDAWFAQGAVPSALFYQDGVGLYPYDAIGDWRHFCAIPVTEDRLREFEEKGAALYEMDKADCAAASAAGADWLPADGGEHRAPC